MASTSVGASGLINNRSVMIGIGILASCASARGKRPMISPGYYAVETYDKRPVRYGHSGYFKECYSICYTEGVTDHL